MNKNLKRIIASTLVISAFSAIEPAKYLNLMTTKAYASSDDDIYLKSITVDGESVSLSKSKTSYTMNVSKSTDEVTIKVRTDDDDDVVTIDGDNAEDFDEDGTGRYKTTVDLDEGNNTFKITVEDEDGDNERTYTLKIDRGGKKSEDDVYLDKISLSEGNISFSQDKTSYNIDVLSSVSKIVVQAKPEDEDYTVEIEGDEVDDDDNYKKTVYLANGKNEISIVVTDDDDNEREYTLTINRGGTTTSTDNGKIDNDQDSIYLDDLILDDGDIGLNFKEKVTSYEVDVKEDYDSIIVKASPEDEDYIVRINGDKADSKYRKRVYLDKGKNVIKIKVSNEDDYDSDDDDYEERTYTLIVYRGTSQGSANNSVSNNTNTTSKSNQWVSINGRWQYNDSLGNPLKNTWFYDRNYNKNYYLQSDGYMATGWINNNGTWYYLDGSGTMQTGWKQINSNWYYLDNSGKMKTGWFKDIDEKYYFLNYTGEMFTNTIVDGYKIGSNGAWIR